MSMIRHCDKCGKALVGEGRKFQHLVIQGRDIDICEDTCLNLFFEWIKEKPVVKTTDIPSKNWTNKPAQEKPATIVVSKPKLPANAEKDPVTTFKNTGEVKSIEQTNLKKKETVGYASFSAFLDQHINDIYPDNIVVGKGGNMYGEFERITNNALKSRTCFKKKMQSIATVDGFLDKFDRVSKWESFYNHKKNDEAYFTILRILQSEGYKLNRIQELELRNHDNPDDDDDIEIKRSKFSTSRNHR